MLSIQTIGDIIWIPKRYNFYVSIDERFVIQRQRKDKFKIYERLFNNQHYDKNNNTHLNIGGDKCYKYTGYYYPNFNDAAEFVDSVLSEQISLF